MKKTITFFLTILILTTALLNANSGEWGALFRESAESLKESHLLYPPEDYSFVQDKWRNPELVLEKYKNALGDVSNSNYNEKREDLVSPFSQYYFTPEWKNNEIAEVFIYVVENDPNIDIKLMALEYLGVLALKGINNAKNFIKSNLNNGVYEKKIRIMFHVQNLTVENDEASIQYLMQVINESQNIKTLEVKYNSKYEVNIAWYLAKVFLQKRYENNLEYDYVLPILKRLIFSQTKNVQTVAVRAYYQLTNKEEMNNIFNDCWAKVQDKTTPRKEYIKSLYGLQALYELREGEYIIRFKGISSYFARLGGLTLVNGNWEWKESNNEKRLSAEEKRYFQKRLGSK